MGTISNPNQFKSFFKPLANANNHIIQQCTSSARKRLGISLTYTRKYPRNTFVLQNLHPRKHGLRKNTFRPFYRYGFMINTYINTNRDNDGNFCYSRHIHPSQLKHHAQKLTTITTSPRCTVCHNPFRSRNNGNTQITNHSRQRIFLPIHTQTRPTNSLYSINNRFSIVIFEYDRKLCFPFKIRNRTIFDITFLFQHISNSYFPH
uniref:Uncharacterized protein n=1 Tax=Candidatus Kentrum sp. LPFa TaxID=2126335 RepID=A0A450WAH0_9GAMM|nr:MAG: hypothetical protein BECKLPF1236B_GA0070989_105411 [Candidatus Kentron sp. LPFa]